MELLPLVVDLNNNPDRIVAALGLDFNPEDELEATETTPTPLAQQALKMLSSQHAQPINLVRQPVGQQPIAQPIGNARIPLDTAQLSIHEQPDRDTSSSAHDRSRDAEPLP